jgi:N-acetylglucosaminyl-diphospho-decaprenol L-rhamnosyltransferase
MSASLDIIIVNWNAGALLRACVQSIVDADQSSCRVTRIVVVDNASSDRSGEGLEALTSAVRVIRNGANRGFAAACNQGAVGTRADYLLFLNPDTRLFVDSLTVPIVYMEAPEHRGVGICGIRMVDAGGRPMVSVARVPTLGTFVGEMTGLSRVWPSRFPPHVLTPTDGRDPAIVDQIIGAFFLVRRALFEALGGFDERFFLYFEEVDFSKRAQLAGHVSAYVATAAAFHSGGYSSSQVRSARLYFSLCSRFRYAGKHYSRLQALVLVVLTCTVECAARLMHATLRGSARDVRVTLVAYLRLAASCRRRQPS